MSYNINTNKSWYQYYNGGNDYVSLAAQVAQRASDLVWGRGYHILSDKDADDLAIKAIVEHNQLEEMFTTMEMDLSTNGNQFACIFPTKPYPTILLSDVELISRKGEAFVGLDAAQTWHRIVIDNVSFPVKCIWDKEKMVMSFWNQKTGKYMSVDTALKDVPKDKWPMSEWQHNLGIIPVVHLKNRAGAFRMYSRSDHHFTGCLEQWYNKSLSNFNIVEVENNLTKIYANMDKKDKAQIRAEAKARGISVKQYIKQLSVIVPTDFSGDRSGDGAKSQLQLIQGNLKAKEWWHHLQQMKAEFFETCGYSYTRPESNTLGGTTGTEVMFTSANDLRVTKEKIALRQKQINELLEKYQIVFNENTSPSYSGVLSGDLTIEIKGNIFQDTIDEVEKSKLKLECGLSTRSREIAKIEGITLKEAEKIAQEAQSEMSAMQEMAAENEPKDNKGDK